MARFMNFYRCPGDLNYRQHHQPEEWEDAWSCTCNDKCPICNAEMEPYYSEDIGALSGLDSTEMEEE